MGYKDKRVQEIISRALTVEGAYDHYGMHAAGVIISDNDNVNDYVPLSWDETNKQWKCQVNMTEAEEAGLLKMDYLGLRNLNIITEILRLIYKRTGKRINPTVDIQEESNVIKSICASGRTNAIFQLESAGMKDVEMKLRPDKFEDLILLLAAYRPGPMDSIPSMIKVKRGKPAQYRHPLLEAILNVTYGSLIYQEQVQQIFRELAGYTFGRADLVRRAMSKKKEAVFLAEKPIFIYGSEQDHIPGCVSKGIPAEVAEAIFDDMVDFAKYAFNKSHAAAYARVTYILTWLKYYYPIEFMAVAMDWANREQLVRLIGECRKNHIEVLPVDINRSGEKFTIKDDKIYFGLTSIKGVGSATAIIDARNKKTFADFKDFFIRAHFRKDITESLIKVGAFDQLHKNRKAVKMAFEEMYDILDKGMKKNTKELKQNEEILKMLICLDNEKDTIDNFNDQYVFKKLKSVGHKNKTIPTIEKQEIKIAALHKKTDEIYTQIEEVLIPGNIDENLENRLSEEKELIGVYLSGHPMDAYDVPAQTISIDQVQPNQVVNICGVISELKIRQRKSDGKDLAFFELEDKSGVIQVACFTKEYEEYSDILGNGRSVCMKGKVMEEEIPQSQDDGDDTASKTVLKISVYQVTALKSKEQEICLLIPCIISWNEYYNELLLPYIIEQGGYKVLLQDVLFHELRETYVHVSKDIKKDPILSKIILEL